MNGQSLTRSSRKMFSWTFLDKFSISRVDLQLFLKLFYSEMCHHNWSVNQAKIFAFLNKKPVEIFFRQFLFLFFVLFLCFRFKLPYSCFPRLVGIFLIMAKTRPKKFIYVLVVRADYTCNFCVDFRCDFLLLMDVKEWMNYQCSDEGIYSYFN